MAGKIEKLEYSEKQMLTDFEIKIKEVLENLQKDYVIKEITAFDELSFEGKDLIIRIGMIRK